MRLLLLATCLFFMASCTTKVPKAPIKALLLTGGCCHNYDNQKKIIQEFTTAELNVTWDVIHEGGKGGNHKFSIYEEEGWADKYDVVVHNECFAKMHDDNFMINVVKDHLKTDIGVIMVHCAMHTFRDAKEGTEAWNKLIGLQSKKHEHQAEYVVENIASQHPIMKEFPQAWTAPIDELYIVIREFPGMTPLARSFGPKSNKFSTCIWTNQIGDNKIFGITFGHNDHTMETKEFQGVFNRGLLWTVGKLKSDGTAAEGYAASK
ncbi:MAG: ThuA domain-containing protein [Lentisphaerales bacterium]|nr:ThuA domain-containing protein [Lentisphaerales bacterium]